MSLVPEQWARVSRGELDGLPMALVAREKDYYTEQKLTVWCLVLRPNGWYNFQQMTSLGVWRKYKERKGVKLSDSRIDSILRDYANRGESDLV